MKQIKRSQANKRKSMCVVYNNTIYTSGITSYDVSEDCEKQTKEVLDIIDKLLAKEGSNKHKVLQASITLKDMDDYAAFNSAWNEWVTQGFEPTRSVVQGGLSVPEYKVKISVIAAV